MMIPARRALIINPLVMLISQWFMVIFGLSMVNGQ